MIDWNDENFTLKPRYIYRFYIYALNSDGSLGAYLGDAYAHAHDEVDAQEYALKTFKGGLQTWP